MHPHLHTKDNTGCEEVMVALEECHARGFMWKAIGMCTSQKDNLTKCLKAERFKNQTANRNEVQSRKDRVRQLWKEIDETS
ncbi:cytochrome c oxidase biogenesis protein Cmc1-like protein [Lasiosphaeria miniovina]|uniref:COX assembly mitochondrial protein n=1 Tax=Lasiosphaeria miniovina TaxID=1954250 RepID=A0AA40BH60_9PEZI|nr:cytochrome c oxidase biogenesis protein Cmc1-like protein [Lasiosphaeria miniovina]KAK0734155.1 cytochrome c oxidase biogenesis protein Cmc1-like protein [Lasiosphaeria miniovina]